MGPGAVSEPGLAGSVSAALTAKGYKAGAVTDATQQSRTVEAATQVFSGAGTWLLQGATLSLSGETLSPGSILALSENGALIVTGGSLTASGGLDLEAGAGLVVRIRIDLT